MASDLTPVSISDDRASTEFELLQVILKEDVYPWNVDDVEGLASLQSAEAEWSQQLSDEDNAAIATHGQQFFQQLTAAWQAVDMEQSVAPVSATPIAAIQACLLEKFQDRVPANLVEQLTQKAQALAEQPMPVVEQLVQCVQEAFSAWSQEDLQVLARPYAFAMRSPDTDKLEVTSQAVRPAVWNDLSDIEQARLGLAIAHYTLAQLKSQSSD